MQSSMQSKVKRIWAFGVRDIKIETKLPDGVVTRSLKSLLKQNKIKEVENVQNKIKKLYMAFDFEPSKELTGGEWYVKGKLDKDHINKLQQSCLSYIRAQKIATSEGVHNELKSKGVSSKQVSEILNNMVLGNDVLKVKSTGLREYNLIPIGTVCYRIASGVGAGKCTGLGAFASLHCGACPRISVCTPDGVISPSNCVYYSNWLDIEF